MSYITFNQKTMNTLIFLLLLFTSPHKLEDKITEPNNCKNYNDSEKNQFTVVTKEESPIPLRFETRGLLETKKNQFYIYGYCSKHDEWLLVAYLSNDENKYYYNPKFLK